MKRGRFSEEQIVGILKEHEAGRKFAELAREHGVRRDGGWGSTTTAGIGRREPRSEATGGRSQLGQEALKAIVRKNGWSLPA